MACAKIVGFDVTPRTWKSFDSMARLPVASRSRLMSSSQIDTSSRGELSEYVLVLLLCGHRYSFLAGAPARLRLSRAACTTRSGVIPNSS